MSDDPGSNAEISVRLDDIPQPSLRYELRGDEPVVTHTNRAFDTTFGPAQTETPLRRCLNSQDVGLDDETIRAVCSSLAAHEPVDVTGEVDSDRMVRVQSGMAAAQSSDDNGIVTLRAGSSDEDPVGVENIATVVSHDLRNPLDVAKAHVRAARERGDEEHFERVDEAHDRMEQIIEDVLTLARGDETITPSETVNIGSVAQDAWSTVDTDDATLDVASDLPTVEADPPRLRRLFENLFRNAVEHGATKHPTESSTATEHENREEAMQIRVGTTADGGFFVADDGVGIPEEDRERVFEPGYSSSDRGAGLGLTIVERIAEAHGWRVSVLTAASDGARFEFRARDAEQ